MGHAFGLRRSRRKNEALPRSDDGRSGEPFTPVALSTAFETFDLRGSLAHEINRRILTYRGKLLGEADEMDLPAIGLDPTGTSMRVPALLAHGVLSDAQFGSVKKFNSRGSHNRGKAPRELTGARLFRGRFGVLG